jgi:hypothetical protein
MVTALALCTGILSGCALDRGDGDEVAGMGDDVGGKSDEVGSMHDEIGSDLAAAASNVYLLGGATCGVVVAPNQSRHTIQLQYLMDSSACLLNHVDPAGYQWALYRLDGAWRIQNVNSNMCMTVLGGSTANGAIVAQTFCTAGHEALWVFDAIPDNERGRRIRNVHSGKCLNISGGPEGVDMVQWPCGNYSNENFYLTPP